MRKDPVVEGNEVNGIVALFLLGVSNRLKHHLVSSKGQALVNLGTSLETEIDLIVMDRQEFPD